MITTSDIKFLASQTMTDADNGGGAPTATAIPDGAGSAIFPPVSELDLAGGRFRLRKVFLALRNLGTDTYLGSNIIISKPLTAENVSVTLFKTGQFFDRRADAVDAVESYLTRGSLATGYLLENHVANQRAIQILQRPETSPPTVGSTLVLVANEGLSNEYYQFVRITRVSSEIRTFTYSYNSTYTDYDAAVITCDISDKLRYDFPGSPPDRGFAMAAGATKLRETLVADAANYYGTVRTLAAADLGARKVRVASIYSQLVPSSQTENAVTDQRPNADFARTIATSPRTVSVTGSPLTQRFRIGQETRRYNYTTILTPLPAPGTVKISYRALGKTYWISDDGNGNLSGAGAGTVNYTTGSVSATLLALPDDRSAVIFYWGQAVGFTSRAGATTYRAPEVALQLAHQHITPGTISISWPSGGVTKTATANAAGVVSGDAVGEANHPAGHIYLRPFSLPDAGEGYTVDYTWSASVEELKTGLTPDGTGSVTVTTAEEPTPGSIELQWIVTRESSTTNGTQVASGSTEKSASKGTNWIEVPGSDIGSSFAGSGV